MIRKRVIATGLVQGVYFRDQCRRRAIANGVSGWVRNHLDGTVEAVFQGPEDRVEEMVLWARHGPRDAEVHHVTVEEEPVEPMDGFEILPSL